MFSLSFRASIVALALADDESCVCEDYVNETGFGNCLKYTSDGKVNCYIKEGAKCNDAKTSEYSGLRYSYEACENLTAEIKEKNKGKVHYNTVDWCHAIKEKKNCNGTCLWKKSHWFSLSESCNKNEKEFIGSCNEYSSNLPNKCTEVIAGCVLLEPRPDLGGLQQCVVDCREKAHGEKCDRCAGSEGLLCDTNQGVGLCKNENGDKAVCVQKKTKEEKQKEQEEKEKAEEDAANSKAFYMGLSTLAGALVILQL